jgi:predicted permease
MQKLLFSLILIISGLICGYILQQIIRKKTDQHHLLLPRLRKSLQRFSMLWIMPISFVGALWIVPFDDMRIALLPLLGSGILLLGGILGLAAAVLLHKTGPQKSVLFCCGSFSNIGSLGGLTSFVFFGEKGFALLALYKVFEQIIYFSIGFPFARYLRSADSDRQTGSRVLEMFKDPFFLVATLSFMGGICLNLSGLARPMFYATLNSLLIPVGIFLVLVSVGLSMRFSNVRNHLFEGLAISLIKFIILPVVAGGAAYLLGLHRIQDGLPLKIALVGASMPVAFMALVAASIYDLDLDLANSCWLITTGAMVVVLPWLYFLFSLF